MGLLLLMLGLSPAAALAQGEVTCDSEVVVRANDWLSKLAEKYFGDPLAVEPAPGEDWVTTPPHIMILLPEKLDLNHFSSDHHSGGPYVMYAGTPYEHIMMPISEELK